MLGQASAVKYVTKFLNTRPHLLAGFFIALSAVECNSYSIIVKSPIFLYENLYSLSIFILTIPDPLTPPTFFILSIKKYFPP